MLQNLRRFKTQAAAIAVAAGLAAVAGANGVLGPLVIVAPTEVYAGNPICGYVTGNEGTTVVRGAANGGTLLGVVEGIADPLYFIFPTIEPMAPGFATVKASDSEESATKNVILK